MHTYAGVAEVTVLRRNCAFRRSDSRGNFFYCRYYSYCLRRVLKKFCGPYILDLNEAQRFKFKMD